MKNNKKLALGLLIGTTLATVFFFYFYQMFTVANILVNKEDQVIQISDNTSFRDLQDMFYRKDIVQDMVSFSFVAKLMKYPEHIKPGRYLMKKNTTNRQAIQMLRAGDQIPVRLTFNNIRTKEDLAERISQSLQMEAEPLLRLLRNSETAKKYGFNTDNFIAMFLPNTYQVYWTISPEQLLERMSKEYKRFWNKKRAAQADSIGLSPAEVITLASIVEAETNRFEEYKIIGGVYMNRIRKGYLLQADPTVIFAHKDFSIKRVLNKHKELDSPYNTYKYRGLPPGPINLPSVHAIDGVLGHASHSYLYFCAKEDFSGKHVFAKNLTAHKKNARRYQQALNRAKIFK
ncbi:MAG: endolytic transglycosylase MltG [Cytophagales bacterium]|nr:endolytic transglycosylase MltG [Cytophagales bacterium]